MDISVLWEDETLLVINKPPFVVVNRAESVQGETVQDWVEKSRHIFIEQRAGIVHRIDKETSGCLLIAKNDATFYALQAQFKERVIKKTYIAIAHGIISPPTGEIRAPVGRLPWNREHFGIVPGGKEAVTRYVVDHSWQRVDGKEKESLTLVTLYPETGRTHQIRVHLKYIMHPIVGDYLYAGRKTARADRLWAPRVMLHAQTITFVHPQQHAPVTVTAPTPDDMIRIIT